MLSSVEVSATNITVTQQPFTGHITQSRHIHSSQSHQSTVELMKPIAGGRIKNNPAAFFVSHPYLGRGGRIRRESFQSVVPKRGALGNRYRCQK